MPKIDVKTETDSPRGWTFAVSVSEGSQQREYQVTLNWSDYDHWSHGRVAPQKVAAAVVAYALDQGGLAELGERFDCARIRRRWPQADHELPKRF